MGGEGKCFVIMYFSIMEIPWAPTISFRTVSFYALLLSSFDRFSALQLL